MMASHWRLPLRLFVMLLAVITLVAGQTRAADIDRATKQESANTDYLPTLVVQLGDDSFLVRQKAMQGLWQLGPRALPELQKAVAGDDPEVSDRARELILYISAGVLFDSPDEVKALVLKFSKSMGEDKLVVLRRLMELKQWKQVLYLAKLEKNPELRTRMAGMVREVASGALRQAIVKGDAGLTEEILSLLGDDTQSMLIRAWIYCHRGQLEQELEKAADITGKQGNLWRMSLHRASGNISAAIREAEKAGEHALADAWRVLEGDALPWLLKSSPEQDRDAIYDLGCSIQHLRLQGKEKEAQSAVLELKPLAADPASVSDVITCLAANGFRDEALDLLREHDANKAFQYYDTTESPKLSLQALGIPEDAKPPYTEWVRKFTDEAIEEEDESLYESLIMLAGFLVARGEREHAIPVLEPMMSALEEDGADIWFVLLGDMQIYDMGAEAIHFIKERGNEHGEADLGVEKLINGMTSKSRGHIWDYLKKRNEQNISKALDELALLSGLVADPDNKAGKLHQILKDEAGELGPAVQQELWLALFELCLKRNDFALASSMADQMAPKEKSWLERKNYLDEALLRWEKIEPVFAQKAKNNPHDYIDLMQWYIALRKLDRDKEAGEIYERVMLLSLGEAAIMINWGRWLYEAGYEKEATQFWIQAAVLAGAKQNWYDLAIHNLAHSGQSLYRSGQWKRAAAISEASSRLTISGRTEVGLLSILRARFYSEFCQGMFLLQTGKKALGIKKLDRARQLIPGDGVLADDFFPLLRGQIPGDVYDRWFEDSYNHLEAACELYPGSHNSHNTAAWLAARAVRELDAAHVHAVSALKARPNQGAYLDTMAEVWFARGDREKALKWSRKAIAGSISNAGGNPRDYRSVLGNYKQITKQYDRFKNDPLPRKAR